MAIESPYKSSVNLRLNAGIKQSTGGMIVKSMSLGKVMAGANAGKIMSVLGALVPVLEFPLYRVERVETSIIEN